MRRQVNAVAVLAVTALVTAGCSQTVQGSAARAHEVSDQDRSYGYVDDRCGLLQDSTVQQDLGADKVVRPYSGAVCQYVLSRQQLMVDVTFSWFETGSLDRERALAHDRGAEITDTVVERHPAFLARRATMGPSCSATAAAGQGVLTWRVQFRAQTADDPCGDARKLLSSTLSSSM